MRGAILLHFSRAFISPGRSICNSGGRFAVAKGLPSQFDELFGDRRENTSAPKPRHSRKPDMRKGPSDASRPTFPLEGECDGQLEEMAAHGEGADFADELGAYDRVGKLREQTVQIGGGSDFFGADATYIRTARVHSFYLRAMSYALYLTGVDPATLKLVKDETLLTPGTLLEVARLVSTVSDYTSNMGAHEDLQRAKSTLLDRLATLLDRGEFSAYPRMLGAPAEAILCIAMGRLERAHALLSVCSRLQSPLASLVHNRLACAYFAADSVDKAFQSHASNEARSADDVWATFDKLLEVFSETGQPISGGTAQMMQNAAASVNGRHPTAVINVQRTEIKGSAGRCVICGERLRPAEQLSANEVGIVEGIIETVLIEGGGEYSPGVFASSTPQEVEQFKKFLDQSPRFEVVVDGLNMLFGGRRRRNVSEMIDQFFNRLYLLRNKYGYTNILVIGRQEMHKFGGFVHRIYNEGYHFFCLERTSVDDGFLLWSAARSGPRCWIYTRDAMTNHCEAIAKRASPEMASKLRNLVMTRRIFPGFDDRYVIVSLTFCTIGGLLRCNRLCLHTLVFTVTSWEN